MMRPTLFALALAAGTVSATQVYKWVDAEGITHFGDLPQDREARRIDLRTPPSPTPRATGAESSGETPDKATTEGGEKNPERAEYCRRARDDLARYGKAERLIRLDEDGKEVEVDDQGRTQLMERTRKQVERWCGE